MQYGKRSIGGVPRPTFKFTSIALRLPYCEDRNLRQGNPQIPFEPEVFPEEFAVDADIENRGASVVDESSAFIG